jgi:hypothetical protein
VEKIILAVWVLSVFKGMRRMKLSCEEWCHIQEMLANLKCPSCFSAKVKHCKGENKENALCPECDCRFEFNPELAERWD